MINFKNHCRVSKGFTIVELGVVIVVIGILVSITVVGYGNWQQSVSSTKVKSDLSGAAAAMESARTFGDAYPTDIPTSFNSSDGVVLEVVIQSDKTFCINGKINTDVNPRFHINQDQVSSGPQAGDCFDSLCIDYPGFIAVPGSSTYNTNPFCVMQYEAKNVGSVATSQAAGAPWVSISQTSAISTSAAACTGCHLITEAEWLTIAQNVLGVDGNWSGGSVGSGCIFRGNVGNSDACGYDGADPESGTGRNAKSSLILDNGRIIWDFSGNVWEWTSATVTTGRPGVTSGGYAWRQWPAVTNPGTLSSNPSPSATGLSGSASWNSTYGVGQLASDADDTSLTAFIRGGDWGTLNYSGVLTLQLGDSPSYSDIYVGFRVAVTPDV